MVWRFPSGTESRPGRLVKWKLDFTESEFMSLKNVSKNPTLWPEKETLQALAWFNDNQAKWGVQPLFVLALEDYVATLLQHFVTNSEY